MRKSLLITLLTSFVVIVSMLVSNVMAATSDIIENRIIGTISRIEVMNEDGSIKYSYTMSVILPPSTVERDIYENVLTKEDVIRLLEGKYKQGIVDVIIDTDGNEVSNKEDKVGTGAVVRLTTGREITIILYGDVTGDGAVDSNDVIALAEHDVKLNVITDENKLKAAELTGSELDGKIGLLDVVRVACFMRELIGVDPIYGMSIIDEQLRIKEDYQEFFDSDLLFQNEIAKINGQQSEEQKFNLNFIPSNEDDKYNQIKFEITNRETKLSDLSYIVKNLIELFENSLNDEKIKEIKVTCGDEEYILKDKTDISVNAIKILGKALNIEYKDEDISSFYNKVGEKTLADLLNVELKLDIILEDTSKFPEGQNGKYIINFSEKSDLDNDKKPDSDEDKKPDLDEDKKPDLDNDKKPDSDEDKKPDLDEDKKPDSDEDKKPDLDEDKKPDLDDNKKSELDSWFKEIVESKIGTPYIEFNFNQEQSSLIAKVIDRKQKLGVIKDQENKVLKILTGLINVQGVKSLNLKLLNSEQELILYSEDKENVLYTALEWFKKSVPNIFDRKDYKDVILGDFAGQKCELNVVFGDDDSNSKTYNIEVIADPIKLTFDYGYKEVDSNSNKIETILQNNAGLVEQKPEPTVIEDGLNKYKFDGWYLKQDDSEVISETKFDFDNTKVYYDTTFVAKWSKLKIVDIDEKIETSLSGIDKEKIESILNIDYRKDENIVLFECIDETKKLSDIENSGLIIALDSILKEDVENIIVEINSKNYELKLSDDLISYKNKILEMINDFIGKNEDVSEEKWKDIKLTELLGKTLKITVNLNNNSIQTNNTTQEVYTINFVEVVPKGKIIGSLLNEGKISDSIYKANYKDGIINVTPKVGDTKLSTIENSEVFKVLVNLVEDNRIAKITLKGGREEETTLDLKSVTLDTTNENTTEKLKNLLKDNWSKLCKCNEEECCKDGCTWEKAENDCLINSGSFDIEVVLSQQSEFELGGKRTENYKINFLRNEVDVKLHFNDNNKTETIITLPEGSILTLEDLNNNIEYPTMEGYEFKYWATDEEGKNEYKFDSKINGDINLELYGIWLKSTDKEVSSAKFLNEIVDALNSGNKEIFKTEFNEESKEVNITIIQDVKLSNFSNLISVLVDTLINTEGLDKIVVSKIPLLQTYTVKKDTDVESLKGILEGFDSATLSKLCGRVLPVQIYIIDGYEFSDKKDVKIDENGNKYIEYQFKFINGIKK